MADSDWKTHFEAEINQGMIAREGGNDGMARVCARRAVGIVIGHYLSRRGVAVTGVNAFNHIQMLLDQPQTPANIRGVASHFLMHVDKDHKLPLDIDLIEEARWLAEELNK